MYPARGPDTKSGLTEICSFKNLFSTFQCSPFKPICSTKDFVLDNSGQKHVFQANLMNSFKKLPTPDINCCGNKLEVNLINKFDCFNQKIYFVNLDAKYHFKKQQITNILTKHINYTVNQM